MRGHVREVDEQAASADLAEMVEVRSTAPDIHTQWVACKGREPAAAATVPAMEVAVLVWAEQDAFPAAVVEACASAGALSEAAAIHTHSQGNLASAVADLADSPSLRDLLGPNGVEMLGAEVKDTHRPGSMGNGSCMAADQASLEVDTGGNTGCTHAEDPEHCT